MKDEESCNDVIKLRIDFPYIVAGDGSKHLWCFMTNATMGSLFCGCSINPVSAIERGGIEVLYKQGKSQSEIARLMSRNLSTISRELKCGIVT